MAGNEEQLTTNVTSRKPQHSLWFIWQTVNQREEVEHGFYLVSFAWHFPKFSVLYSRLK